MGTAVGVGVGVCVGVAVGCGVNVAAMVGVAVGSAVVVGAGVLLGSGEGDGEAGAMALESAGAGRQAARRTMVNRRTRRCCIEENSSLEREEVQLFVRGVAQ